MTITSAKTNKYGPGSLNIQFEDGADFVLTLDLERGNPLVPWDISTPGTEIEACVSNTWNPGPGLATVLMSVEDLTAEKVGRIRITLSRAAIEALPLPVSPAQMPAPTALGQPSRFVKLGGWTLSITQDDFKQRILDGDVQLDRDPCRK